jgi:hypothetical protein
MYFQGSQLCEIMSRWPQTLWCMGDGLLFLLEHSQKVPDLYASWRVEFFMDCTRKSVFLRERTPSGHRSFDMLSQEGACSEFMSQVLCLVSLSCPYFMWQEGMTFVQVTSDKVEVTWSGKLKTVLRCLSGLRKSYKRVVVFMLKTLNCFECPDRKCDPRC